MSKLKSALLLSVALSPIFVSTTRGIEVVHAEVVQNAVAQQVKNVAEAKSVKQTDKKSDTVAATKQDDSDATDLNKADSGAKKSDVIAFDDKNFQQKFKGTNYYQEQKAMYGENKPASDAKLAADSAGYIATIIGEKFLDSVNKPTVLKALGFAGPLGSLLSCLIDWFTPAARNKTDEKLNEISKKLDDLGIHLDNVGSAISDKVDQSSIENRIESFKGTLTNTRTPFGTVAGEISQYQSGHHITLASKDTDDVKKYVSEYAKLYHTSDWGFDDKKQEVSEVPNSDNLKVFNDFCNFGATIVSANFKDTNIFRVMSDYESLREFFNTQTFATREAFAEYVMSHYTVWASDMMTAIFFDYFRVKGQLDQITASADYKESVTAAKNNGTTIDSEFKKRCPISYSLFNGLRSNARDDLMRLGYDVESENGHNNSYDLDAYDKNNWVYKYNNNSVFLGKKETNILGANVNAVNYAYATEIENKPVKTVVGIDPAYQEKLATAKQKASDADAEENRTHYARPFYYMDWDKAREAQKAAHEALDQLVASGENIYQDKALEDEKGNPIVATLKSEEKTSNDGKILYSYRTKNWVYNRLDQQTEWESVFKGQQHSDNMNICACDFAKNAVNILARKKIEEKSGDWLATCWDQNSDVYINDFFANIIKHVMLKSDTDTLNTIASDRHKGGINSLIKNTVTKTVNGVKMIGFEGNSDRLVAQDDFKLDDAGEYGFCRKPTYNIGLGEYKNDHHIDPTNDTKTLYQNFDWNTTSSNPDKHKAGYNEKQYDWKGVNFIKVAKDGDALLDGLKNGNKTPNAPEHFAE